MRRQHGLVPGKYFFFPSLLEVEGGDVVSHSISVLTCSDATCQPAGVYGLLELFSFLFSFSFDCFRTMLVNHLSL